jgi:hypothetical protein
MSIGMGLDSMAISWLEANVKDAMLIRVAPRRGVESGCQMAPRCQIEAESQRGL